MADFPSPTSAYGIWKVMDIRDAVMGVNWPQFPGPPTIGTASVGSSTGTISVAFTAPTNVGSSAITSYTATSSPGGITGSGASSPVSVTGLTVGTSYTFTVTATNSQGTGVPSAASNSVVPIQLDQYFNSVTMLLAGNGTNGAQNNTFVDSSASPLTLTRNGNTTQGTLTPYGTLWSNYFGTTADYLTTSSAAIDGLSSGSSGNYTVEAWVYLTTAPSGTTYSTCAPIAAKVVSGGGLYQLWGITSTGYITLTRDGSTYVTATGTTPSLKTWNHLAFVNSGTTITVYLNGASVATMSSTGTWHTGGTTPLTYIGRNYYASLIGYMSNLRMVAGTAVYTGAFTPSTVPLTTSSQNVSAANTKLLTCQSSRFVDNSTNAYAVTAVGAPTIQRLSPFNPTSAYSTSTIGGSGYFDGTGDYLSTPTAAGFQFGTGDFTIEMWLYANSTSTTHGLVASNTAGAGYWASLIFSGTLYWQSQNGATNLLSTSYAGYYNQWTHVAFVRSSGTTKMYLNGVQTATAADATNYTMASGNVDFGRDSDNAALLNGYLSNVRVIKGVAVYTGAFTPPALAPLGTTCANSTSAYSSTTNVNTSSTTAATVLLLSTNAGIYDNAMMCDLETVGNAQISTAQSKFGGSSMYFDGSGDYLYTKSSVVDIYQLGVGNQKFTVEAWIYPTSVGVNGTIVERGGGGSGWNSTTGISWTFFQHSSNSVYFQWWTGSTYGGAYTPASLAANTWQHVAAVYDGTTTTVYLNGTAVGGGTSSSAYGQPSATNQVRVGMECDGTVPYTGYIDDLRITKGVARYTTTFTPPTAAFPTQ